MAAVCDCHRIEPGQKPEGELDRHQLVELMFAFAVVSGLCVYITSMQTLRSRNYEAAVVHSYAWKIGLGYTLLTLIVSLMVRG